MSSLPQDAATKEEASIRRFNRRLRRGNVRLWNHSLAWAEILDALGWCVALRAPDSGVYLSSNALRQLSNAVQWEDVLREVLTRSAGDRRVNGDDVQVWTAAQTTGAPATGPVTALTPREGEVFKWLREGKTGPEITVILGCGQRTVESHVARLYRKLGIRNRTQVMLRSGLKSTTSP